MTGTSTVYAAGARFLYALDAATGAVVWKTEIGPKDTAQPQRVLQLVIVWQTGLPCAEMGTPSADGAGVLAGATNRCAKRGTPGAYLIDASTGGILTALPAGSSRVFAQPVFAQGGLFVATETQGGYDFAP